MPKKRKPSKPSPKPAVSINAILTKRGTLRKVKPGAGRPEGTGYHPTDDQRNLVRAMAGYRMPQDEMVLLVINPATKRPISEITLRKHFVDELAQGYASLRMRIMAATVRNALGDVRRGEDGTTEVVREGNVTAQIWLQKTLYGAREQVDVVPPPPVKTEEDENTLDAARRVAFTMALGARIIKEQKPAKPKR